MAATGFRDPQAELRGGRAGERLAQVLECLLGGPVVCPDALSREFDGHSGVVDEGLLEKRDQERRASPGVHALALGHRGLPTQWCPPWHPVGVERGQLPGVNPGMAQALALRERLDVLGSGGRRGVSAQPMEPGPAGARIGPTPAVQHGHLRLRQEWGEPTTRLQVGLRPRRRQEAFQTGEARAHNLVTAPLVTGQLEPQRRVVGREGAFLQPRLQGIEIQGSGQATPPIHRELHEGRRPRVPPPPIGVDGLGGDFPWSRDIRDHRAGGGVQVIGSQPQVAHGTARQRNAQPGMGLARLVDDARIGRREQANGAPVRVGNLGGQVVEPVACRRREPAHRPGALRSAHAPVLTSRRRPPGGGPVARFRCAVCRLIHHPLTNACRAWPDERA